MQWDPDKFPNCVGRPKHRAVACARLDKFGSFWVWMQIFKFIYACEKTLMQINHARKLLFGEVHAHFFAS